MEENKGLEKLLYNGVHPECVGKQHSSWKNSWVSVSELNEENIGRYRGLLYVYFVDKTTGLLYCYDNLEEAQENFNKDKHIPVEVSVYDCHVVKKLCFSI